LSVFFFVRVEAVYVKARAGYLVGALAERIDVGTHDQLAKVASSLTLILCVILSRQALVADADLTQVVDKAL